MSCVLIIFVVALFGLGCPCVRGDDGYPADDQVVSVCYATMCLGWAMLRYAQLLRRVASIRPITTGPKRRKVETVARGPYAWEEEGYEGIGKVRVKDPKGRPGWAKFVTRQLGS